MPIVWRVPALPSPRCIAASGRELKSANLVRGMARGRGKGRARARARARARDKARARARVRVRVRVGA